MNSQEVGEGGGVAAAGTNPVNSQEANAIGAVPVNGQESGARRVERAALGGVGGLEGGRGGSQNNVDPEAKLVLNLEKMSVSITSDITFNQDKNKISNKTLSYPRWEQDFSLIVEKMDDVYMQDQHDFKTPLFKLYYDKLPIPQKETPFGYQKQFVRCFCFNKSQTFQ